ncbi:MAG: hypothetical protein KGQ41_02425 [Alphaproteobacteria bacterium]|nr:hypothetical protein [Alphaproteobacteria bacterium]
MAMPHPANAQDDSVYTVKGVQVDVSGTSALDARKKAFTEARRKAYGMMADKILSAEQRPNLVMPDDKVLASLVRDFEIVQEKMTTKRYAGTLDIRFTPAAVKRTIQIADVPQTQSTDQTAQGAQPVDAQTQTSATAAATSAQPAISAADAENYIYSPSRKGVVPTSAPKETPSARKSDVVLVLPWYGPIGRQTLWGPNNPWRAAWESNGALENDKTLPVVLPVGDVEDMRDYAPPQPLSRRGNVEALMKRYGATQAVLALAEQSAGGVLISLYQFQNGVPIPMGRFGLEGAAGDEAALKEAVAKSVASLKVMPGLDLPVASTPVSMTPETRAPIQPAQPEGGQYRTLARFSGLQQWVAMRQALARVPGLTSLNVRAISPSQANVDFAFAGDSAVLMGILAQSGLDLEPAPEGISTADRPAQYTLGFKRGM